MPRQPRYNLTATLIALALLATAAPARAFDLQRAIDDAVPHDTIRVPAGTHVGTVRIDKPLTLIGADGAILDGNSVGDVVKIEAPDVTLRHFTIQSTGLSLDRENAGVTVLGARARIEHNTFRDVLFGVYLKEAPGTVIRHNDIGGKDVDIARRGDGIRLWYSNDCTITDNQVHHSRDVVMWFSDRVRLERNTVTHGRYGLHFMYSDGNVIVDNVLRDNSVGAFLMYSSNLTLKRNRFIRNRGPSGYGIGLKDMDGITAEDNRFLGNRIGIYLDNSPSSVDITHRFERNLLAYNDIGIAFQPLVKRNRFTRNTFLENIEQVAVYGDGTFAGGNDFTVAGQGNFWSDYTGYDRDGDGLGDIEYRAESLFENLMDRQPSLRLFLFSPAQQAVELASEAFPAFRPRPKLTDTAPLMRPVGLDAAPLKTRRH
ncbi:MAG: nitrous oxide reductase family maturation protein NosD, partial [Phycisphaeraceae bacterium]